MTRLLSGKIEVLVSLPTNPEPEKFYLVEYGGETKFYLSNSKAELFLLNSETAPISIDDGLVAFGGGGSLIGDTDFTFVNDLLSVDNVSVLSDSYGTTWKNSTNVPTKGDLFVILDQILSKQTKPYIYEIAQDAVGSILSDSSTIDFQYNDSSNVITANVITDSITFDYVQNISTSKVLGRSTAGTGNIEELSIGSSLSITGGTLSTIQALHTTATPTFDGLTINGVINVTSGNTYRYNSVNMIRAVTANSNYFFGPSGNLTLSGSNNLFVGSGGGGLTSGGYNVAVGVSAGNSLSSGTDNLFFGVLAGRDTTTGFNNCFFGSSAGLQNSEGAHNTAFGREALTTNHKGYYCTAIGHNALKLVDSASAADLHNTGIGSFAGNTITSGIKNTVVGGNSTTGITTGSSNTILGANVSGLSTSLANNIILADGDGNICLQYDATVWQVKKGLTMTDAKDIAFATGTGTKIGTATSQKLSFWNATPIIQPTTGVGSASFTANSGTAVNDASTFDGYTIGQIVKALRNEGLLA